MPKKKYYLAYGSNLNMEQMAWRCPYAVPLGTAEIKGYRLLFKGSSSGSYLTIEKADGCSVPVGVWAVTETDEAKLDRYEGYPRFYYKAELPVTYTGLVSGKKHKVKAFIYIMHEDRAFGLPSKTYVETCRYGYYDFGFNQDTLTQAVIDTMEEMKWKQSV